MSKYKVLTTFETVAHIGTIVHSVVEDAKGEAVSNAVTFIPGAVISADEDGAVNVQTGKQLLAQLAGDNSDAALEEQLKATLEKIAAKKK
jgi:regulator of RNase E activity RraA